MKVLLSAFATIGLLISAPLTVSAQAAGGVPSAVQTVLHHQTPVAFDSVKIGFRHGKRGFSHHRSFRGHGLRTRGFHKRGISRHHKFSRHSGFRTHRFSKHRGFRNRGFFIHKGFRKH